MERRRGRGAIALGILAAAAVGVACLMVRRENQVDVKRIPETIVPAYFYIASGDTWITLSSRELDYSWSSECEHSAMPHNFPDIPAPFNGTRHVKIFSMDTVSHTASSQDGIEPCYTP